MSSSATSSNANIFGMKHNAFMNGWPWWWWWSQTVIPFSPKTFDVICNECAVRVCDAINMKFILLMFRVFYNNKLGKLFALSSCLFNNDEYTFGSCTLIRFSSSCFSFWNVSGWNWISFHVYVLDASSIIIKHSRTTEFLHNCEDELNTEQ